MNQEKEEMFKEFKHMLGSGALRILLNIKIGEPALDGLAEQLHRDNAQFHNNNINIAKCYKFLKYQLNKFGLEGIQQVEKDEIDLQLNFSIEKYNRYNVNGKLIDYTDNIYYKNGIMDKIYYDSTLTKAVIKQPIFYQNHIFKYKDMYFDKIASVFYFDNNLNFVGSVWDNLYKIK